ncbi:MAG: hypothetical protein CM1200mP31_3310 [Candidatus Neomarinimicrobiota bacterium]|nr:MAG: hypothetical protein CM1200mP31_3310 [Candidatus Neomarinimicrobiota bacterium]
MWSTLFGYIALGPDLDTVLGIQFYKHGETPGLGGEVEKEWFTKNFLVKKLEMLRARLWNKSFKG